MHETFFAVVMGIIMVGAPVLLLSGIFLPVLIIWWSKKVPVQTRLIWTVIAYLPLMAIWYLTNILAVFHFVDNENKIMSKTLSVLLYAISVAVCVFFKLRTRKQVTHPDEVT